MFADVILPLPLADTFTYRITEKMRSTIRVGFRVIVPFGKRKFYTAIVAKIHENAPDGILEVKEIHSLIDSQPIVNENQIRLWEWISFYYLSPLGDVYKAALPSMLKPQDLEERYKSKTETFVRLLNPTLDNQKAIIGRATKQLELYNALRSILDEKRENSISKKEVAMIDGFSASAFNGLITKNILGLYTKDVSRIEKEFETIREPFPLNEFQQTAYDEINECFDEKNVCLLHGVTSSGKTEIYIHLATKLLEEGKQVLYLVPEIALTTQLTARLRAVFGEKLGIYHSKISDNERAEIWQKMLSDSPYDIVIGVRSSIFLPFHNLGLIIVDEEHETSYKQHEPAPRYQARDAAIVLAQMVGAKTLLGSATPSMESYYNAQVGKFGLVKLDRRFENIELPRITLEDTFELRRKKKMKSVLAPDLIDKIHKALERGEQVILFRNRRGFAPMLECKLCGWTPKCRQCDVSLTYHKYRNELKCHYCNSSYRTMVECPVCHEKSVELRGIGTEKLEEEVASIFPDASIGRMDTDTTRGKNTYEKIIHDFEDGKIQILVGTQMLSKGLDFDNVSIVGIISADSLLNHPNFRSHERGFQLMMQASGRAGRKNKQGEVVIQTNDPKQPIYRYLQTNDYEGFFRAQLAERKLFNYPPFRRLISIVLKHKEEEKVEAGADFFARVLKKSLGEMVLGPNKPVISRIQQYYIRDILLKLDLNISPHKVRKFLKSVEQHFRENPDFKNIVLYYDVDGG